MSLDCDIGDLVLRINHGGGDVFMLRRSPRLVGSCLCNSPIFQKCDSFRFLESGNPLAVWYDRFRVCGKYLRDPRRGHLDAQDGVKQGVNSGFEPVKHVVNW